MGIQTLTIVRGNSPVKRMLTGNELEERRSLNERAHFGHKIFTLAMVKLLCIYFDCS